MKRLLFSICITLALGDTMANNKVSSALDQYAWEKRQLIVFAPNKEHPQYQMFKKYQADSVFEFQDRKLQTWFAIGDQAIVLNEHINEKLSSKDFRDTFGIQEMEFRLLLIGYDQGVKLIQNKVNIQSIFDEIDSMPMRAQEMRSN